MQSLTDDFFLWLQMRSARPATISFYKSYLHRIFTNCNITWEDFGNRNRVYSAYEKVWKLDISNHTRKKYIITMRIFADFLIYKKFFKVNYPRELKNPKVQKAIPFSMDRESFIEVYSAIYRRWGNGELGRRNKMIFDTILYTGLRREELTKIKREDCSIEKVVVTEGKGGKRRVVFLPEHFGRSLMKFITETDGGSEYLFYSVKDGSKLGNSAISSTFQRIAKLSDMKVYAHLMRHTYASNCIIDGIDIYTLQQNLGHSDIKTTSIYLYLNDKERHRKMQLLK